MDKSIVCGFLGHPVYLRKRWYINFYRRDITHCNALPPPSCHTVTPIWLVSAFRQHIFGMAPNWQTHTADQLLYQDHKVAGNFRLRKTPSPKLPKGDKVNPMLTLVKIDIPFFRRSTVGYWCLSRCWSFMEQSRALTADVTTVSSLPVLKNRLNTKSYLFRRCYDILWHFPYLTIMSLPSTQCSLQ